MNRERFTLTVQMQVTEPQAIALSAMFTYWNQLASMGSSREVAFYVDGDGNFKPQCKVTTDRTIYFDDETAKAAICWDRRGDRLYDFDAVAWKSREAKQDGS